MIWTDHAMMSKLLIIIAFSTTLFLVLTTLPADAAVKGSLTSAGGHKCDLKETSVGSSDKKRRLRLKCICKDANSNDIEYTCFYLSLYDQCCKYNPIPYNCPLKADVNLIKFPAFGKMYKEGPYFHKRMEIWPFLIHFQTFPNAGNLTFSCSGYEPAYYGQVTDHYHCYEPAYYGQAADKIKGKKIYIIAYAY